MKNYFFIALLLIVNFVSAQIYDVVLYEKIADGLGGFEGTIENGDWFGYSVESIGDLNGDNIDDLAVGSLKDDDGGYNRGAIYILFLNLDGTVDHYQKISNTEGGFEGDLDDWDIFGTSISYLGDLNNDGLIEIGVGAEYDGDGGHWNGAAWILSLNSDGTVNSHVKISDTEGGFNAALGVEDVFGTDIELLGDLNNDGNNDIAVSARRDPDGGSDRGAVYILFLNSDLTVSSYQKISDTQGGFDGDLDGADYFGGSVANIGDLNNDGIIDLAVGAYRDDDGGENKGAIYILFMNEDGTVSEHQKISEIYGGFNENLDNNSFFGQSIDTAPDINNDGFKEIIVGARGLGANDEENIGAFYIINLNTDGTVNSFVKYSEGYQYFDGDLTSGDSFGFSVSYIKNLNAKNCIGVGAFFDDENGTEKGSVWIIQLGEILSVETLESFNDNFIYPNPTRNSFSLNSVDNVNSVSIYDITGKLVISFKEITNNLFNVSYLPSNGYIVKVISEKGTSSFKLIIE
jgi:hypothetical protein